MEVFFSDDDLLDILEELDTLDENVGTEEDEEMEASNRRYEEIIKKYKD